MQPNPPVHTPLRLAVLIDADNVKAKLIRAILKQISYYGKITICRAYGTHDTLQGWLPRMQAYGIRPILQLKYADRKNVTDFGLVIDAMDILHARQVQGFCIVSSDVDYTFLCKRLREDGLFVMGIGKSTTPKVLVKGYHVFMYTEKIEQLESGETPLPIDLYAPDLDAIEKAKNRIPKPAPPAKLKKVPPVPASSNQQRNQKKKQREMRRRKRKQVIKMLETAVNQSAQLDGWATLQNVSSNLQTANPQWQASAREGYDMVEVDKLVKHLNTFFETANGNNNQLRIRIRKKETSE